MPGTDNATTGSTFQPQDDSQALENMAAAPDRAHAKKSPLKNAPPFKVRKNIRLRSRIKLQRSSSQLSLERIHRVCLSSKEIRLTPSLENVSNPRNFAGTTYTWPPLRNKHRRRIKYVTPPELNPGQTDLGRRINPDKLAFDAEQTGSERRNNGARKRRRIGIPSSPTPGHNTAILTSATPRTLRKLNDSLPIAGSISLDTNIKNNGIAPEQAITTSPLRRLFVITSTMQGQTSDGHRFILATYMQKQPTPKPKVRKIKLKQVAASIKKLDKIPKAPESGIKEHTVTLTKARIEKWEGTKRSKSQHQVMGNVSASMLELITEHCAPLFDPELGPELRSLLNKRGITDEELINQDKFFARLKKNIEAFTTSNDYCHLIRHGFGGPDSPSHLNNSSDSDDSLDLLIDTMESMENNSNKEEPLSDHNSQNPDNLSGARNHTNTDHLTSERAIAHLLKSNTVNQVKYTVATHLMENPHYDANATVGFTSHKFLNIAERFTLTMKAGGVIFTRDLDPFRRKKPSSYDPLYHGRFMEVLIERERALSQSQDSNSSEGESSSQGSVLSCSSDSDMEPGSVLSGSSSDNEAVPQPLTPLYSRHGRNGDSQNQVSNNIYPSVASDTDDESSLSQDYKRRRLMVNSDDSDAGNDDVMFTTSFDGTNTDSNNDIDLDDENSSFGNIMRVLDNSPQILRTFHDRLTANNRHHTENGDAPAKPIRRALFTGKVEADKVNTLQSAPHASFFTTGKENASNNTSRNNTVPQVLQKNIQQNCKVPAFSA